MDADLQRIAAGFYLDELNDHATYTMLAQREAKPQLRGTLQRLAGMELGHSNFWKRILQNHGAPVPAPRIRRVRLWLLRLLQRLVNPVWLLAALELGEHTAIQSYYDTLQGTDLGGREREGLKRILLDEISHESLFKHESESLGVANIRDFVLGMNDGLVEILGTVAGLSAVYVTHPLVVGVSAVVVGIAGALSMGIGAFISVRSQRQVNDGTRWRRGILFEVAPEKATEEYRDELLGSGVPRDVADEIVQRLGDNREALSRLLLPASEEHEIRSGLWTGSAYLIGVFFPVVPFFFMPTTLAALPLSVLFAGTALASVGLTVAMLSGIPIRRKIVEMVVSAFGAAALSYAFGTLMQSAFGIGAAA